MYPPEDAPAGHQEAFAAFREPMDTIFVKHVREGGPAYRAGLRMGDRIVSVNGESVLDRSYAQVVQMVKRTGEVLNVMVVPKEDDILQMVRT